MTAAQERAGQRGLQSMPAADAQRVRLAKLYDEALARRTAGRWHCRTDETVLLRYPVRVSNKDELLDRARPARIELGSWFETPLHPAPLERHAVFDYQLGQCPHAEAAARAVVNLPLHASMDLNEAERVVEFVVRYGRPAGAC
jgi:perosamine synthetase